VDVANDVKHAATLLEDGDIIAAQDVFDQCTGQNLNPEPLNPEP